MALDGVVQFTERDEFIYREMMTHVRCYTAHGHAKHVLIVSAAATAQCYVKLPAKRRNHHHGEDRRWRSLVLPPVFTNHNAGSYDDPLLRW